MAKTDNSLQWPDCYIEFGDLADTRFDEKLPVTVRLTRPGEPNRPVVGWAVELYKDGRQWSEPSKKPITLPDGTVGFVVVLSYLEPVVGISAKIFHKYSPKSSKVISRIWDRAKAKMVEAPKPSAPEINFERSWPDSTTPEIYKFDIVFEPGKNMKIKSDLPEVLWRRPGEAGWKTKNDSWSTGMDGKPVIELKLPDGQRGRISFESDGVVSGPSYLKNDKGVGQSKPTP